MRNAVDIFTKKPPSARRAAKARASLLSVCVFAALALTAATAFAGPYAPAGGHTGATAIYYTDPNLVEWASGATIVRGLREIDKPSFGYPYWGGPGGSPANTAPLGQPPSASTAYAVALGQGGTATLTFAKPIVNGPDADFAVFGNGFPYGSGEWAKLAFVEVSSDGVNFFRFPSVSLTQTTTQIGSYGITDPTNLYDLAGKDPAGYGTPFDLSELAGVSPLLNIYAVTQVRLVDAVGVVDPNYSAYTTYDSQGHKVNAPWPANAIGSPQELGSEGFCLAGVGVTHDDIRWNNASGGSFNDSNNWNIQSVPAGADTAIAFAGTLAGSAAVTVDANVTVGHLTFSSANSYTVSGSRAITLAASAGDATITADANCTAANHTLSADLTFASNTDLTVLAGQLTLGGAVQFGSVTVTAATGTVNLTGTAAHGAGAKLVINAGATVNLSGAGDALGGVDVLNNSATTLHVTAGSHTAGLLTGAGNTTIDANASLTARNVFQNALTVNGLATIAGISPADANARDPNHVSRVNSLTIAGAADAWTGALDLTDTDLIVNYAPGSEQAVFGSLFNQIKSGANYAAHGYWNGPGITSSAAASNALTNTALGIVDNNLGDGATLTAIFDGQAVDANCVLIKYTYFGDTNLDGTVDLNDYTRWKTGFLDPTKTGWFYGDFNYDGAVDLNDYTIWKTGFLAAQGGAPVLGGDSIPEPVTMTLLALGGLGILADKRRQ